MSGRPPLRARRPTRPWTEEPRLVAPCFRRGPAGTRADARQSQPALLSFDSTDFVDHLLGGLEQLGERGAHPSVWPPLRAWRDWSEPPRSTLDVGGRSRLPGSVRRRAPAPVELHPDPDPTGRLTGDLDAILSREEAARPPWIRKLYLPLHRRFTVVMDELVCDTTGLPRLDPARVMERGMVLRRLAPDPRGERWLDWVVGPEEGLGVWVELADPEMRREGELLDPLDIKLNDVQRNDIGARLGASGPWRARLATTRMTPVPPGKGPVGRRTASFGVLTLFSADQEPPPPPRTGAREIVEDMRAALGLDQQPPDEILWPELEGAAEDLIGAITARRALLGLLGGEVSLGASLAELGADVSARLGAEVAREADLDPAWADLIAWHEAALALEERISAVEIALSAGGDAAWAELTDREPRTGSSPEDAVLEAVLDPLLTRLHRLPGPTRADVEAFIQRAARRVTLEPQTERLPLRPRLDADHVYAVWTYARVRHRDPCCGAPRVVWSRRSEPFCIAEPMDVLGLRPAQIRMPDLARLARDMPRIPRAGAFPMAIITTPPDSSVSTSDEAADTAREWGVAWICSIGIPVLTFCAWVMFSFIFKILIALPGFAWMLLLKLCVPVPVPKEKA